jgi:RNA polymerase sigma-70 factor, ECF subfamily
MDSSSIDAKLLFLPFSETRPNKAFPEARSHFDGGTDEWLLSCVQAGESEALASLFRRYADQIRGLGRRILRDSGEAEDLVQEVFIYVYRKCGLFQHSKGGGRSWIFQIAYTQALIRRRHLKSRGVYFSVVPESASKSQGHDSLGAKYDDTVEGLFGKMQWKKVWDSLTDCQRETLRLHFYEGCTFIEIAEKLGQSYVNIRHHYYRGLEKLRKHADENALNWP